MNKYYFDLKNYEINTENWKGSFGYANHESLQDLLDKEERSLAEDEYDNTAV